MPLYAAIDNYHGRIETSSSARKIRKSRNTLGSQTTDSQYRERWFDKLHMKKAKLAKRIVPGPTLSEKAILNETLLRLTLLLLVSVFRLHVFLLHELLYDAVKPSVP